MTSLGPLKPPVARYRLELSITGNTIEELTDELSVQMNDFGFESLGGRTVRDQWGGRHHLEVTEPNPTMTPERYEEELMAWAAQRREDRRQVE